MMRRSSTTTLKHSAALDNTYIHGIRQTWHGQMRVPRKRVSIIEKPHLQLSIRARDINEERRRKHAIVASFHRVIKAA